MKTPSAILRVLSLLTLLSPLAAHATNFNFSGYGEGYYSYNLNAPQDDVVGGGNDATNLYRAYDNIHNSLELNLAELLIVAKASDLEFYGDFSWGPMADALASSTNTRNITQAYVRFFPTFAKATLDLGKFSSHLGLEAIRARDNWNFSRGWNYTYGTPTLETGARLNGSNNSNLDWTVQILNGNAGDFTDNNDSKSLAGGVKFKKDSLTLGYGLKMGAEKEDNEADQTTIHDFNAQLDLNSQTSLAAEVVIGKIEANTNDLEWTGLALYLKYSLNTKGYIAGRIEIFDDKNGGVFVANSTQDQKLTGLTLTYGRPISANADFRLEFRHDKSDFDNAFYKGEFTSNNPTNSQTTLLAGLIVNI